MNTKRFTLALIAALALGAVAFAAARTTVGLEGLVGFGAVVALVAVAVVDYRAALPKALR